MFKVQISEDYGSTTAKTRQENKNTKITGNKTSPAHKPSKPAVNKSATFKPKPTTHTITDTTLKPRDKEKTVKNLFTKIDWDDADAEKKKKLYAEYTALLTKENADRVKRKEDPIEKYSYITEYEQEDKEKDKPVLHTSLSYAFFTV